MAMLECVHQHISEELRQGARTDTVLVVTAVVFDLVVLAINSSFAASAAYQANQRVRAAARRLEKCQNDQRQVSRNNRFGSQQLKPEECPQEHESRRPQLYTAFFLVVFIAMTALLNAVSLAALHTNRDTRTKLLEGLIRMYKDTKVDKYYDHSLLKNYAWRYRYFELVILGLASTALLVPIIDIRM